MAQKKTLVLTIALVIMANFLPLLAIANWDSFFLQRFEHYQVYDNFSETQPVVKANFTDVMDYLNYRIPDVDQQFFSQEDSIHLQDVRLVLNVMRVLAGFSFAIAFIYLYRRKFGELRKSLRQAGIAILVLLLLIGLYGVFNFDQAFVQLHELVFWNDYWSLDPATSNLIRYFPQQLFFEVFVIYLVSTILLAITGILFARKSKQ
jgi:integral membrane protein (TIGR01906 family)